MSGESFAEQLRHRRLTAGLTQEELAEASGLSARGISDLERGVKLRPHPETVRLLAAALGLTADALTDFRAAAVPQSQTEAAVIPALPVSMTPLLGRDNDTKAVSALIQPDRGTRLVTLTGPGGVGKTRLSIQVAEEIGARFSDGVVFVPLAGLSDPDLVPEAIVQTLGLRESPDRSPLSQLARHLQPRQMLIVLDNFEHLLAAAPQLTQLLTECRRLVVLVSSRAPLRLAGEMEYPVRPLPLPLLTETYSASELVQSPAVQLFVQQSRLVQPNFALTQSTMEPIATICNRLDGLPLALELAAVRLKSLAPAELASLLTNRLGLLTGGPRDRPARQQTMRSAIGWSYDLMDPDEQAVFWQLAVFTNGATREAAAAVVLGDDVETVNDLTSLLDQSLLQRGEGPDGESRYAMLETIREYGLEQLIHSGEEGAVRDRHAAWFLQFAEQGEEGLTGPDHVSWMHRLAADYDNLRAAIGWYVEKADAERSQRMGSALWRFWAASARLREGRDWLDRALALFPEDRTYARGRALLRRGNIAIDLADYPAAERFYEQSRELHMSLGDDESAARALDGLGIAFLHQGKLAEAASAYEATLDLWRNPGRVREEGMARFNLGKVETARELYSTARSSFAMARKISQEMSDIWRLAYIDLSACRMERFAGNFQQAERLLGSSRLVIEPHQNSEIGAYLLAELGSIAGDQGDWEQCVDCHLRSIEFWEKSGDPLGMVESLEEIARAALAKGMDDPGIALLAACAAWREEHAAPCWPVVQRQLDGGLEASRRATGAKDFEVAWQRGRALTIDEARLLTLTIVSALHL